MPRADDDAHTLTMAPSPATEWVSWQWPSEPAPTLRTSIAARPPVTVTVTL